jgi:conjugal transfer pilus assembly protein TraV
MIRLTATVLLAVSSLVAAGCTTLGTNVSGSFVCEGPQGVCAPSSSIDDGAIAEISQTESTEQLTPAGPYRIDEGMGRAIGPVMAAAPPAAAPTQSADSRYTLKVVFPAHVDATGQLHERASVETSVQMPGYGDAVTSLAQRGPGSGRQGLLAAAERAPSLLAMAASAPVPAPVAEAAPAAAEPTGEAVAVTDPVTRIRDQVQTALAAQAPRRQAGSFPATPE